MAKGDDSSEKYGEYKPLDDTPLPEGQEVREYFDDEDEADSAPTLNEKPETIQSSSIPAGKPTVPKVEENFDDDFAPTIMERPAASQPAKVTSETAKTSPSKLHQTQSLKKDVEKVASGIGKTTSKTAHPDDDDDFLPTITERPSDKQPSDIDKTGILVKGGAPKPAIPADSDSDEDDDFTPTISEQPGSKSKSKSSTSKSTDKSSSTIPGVSGVTNFLKSSGLKGVKGATPSEGDQPLSLEKYEIGSKIAEGGMGAILTANDLNIKRNVAMKVLLEGRQKSSENVFRFIEEGQVTGQLEHPSIVPVYELGFNNKGEVYYTMKFVKGVNLKDILKKIGKNDPETLAQYPLVRLLTIFQKVCDAMAFAHSKGIIHRDLKPENIMIGDFGEVLVMDWGLSKNVGTKDGFAVNSIRFQTDSSTKRAVKDNLTATVTGLNADKPGDATQISSGETKTDTLKTKSGTVSPTRGIDSLFTEFNSDSMNTLDGQIMGTPNFMAPEQATGQVDKMDGRTDIYALGGILYNILTLRVPIAGKSLTEMMVNIVKGNIPPPISFNVGAKKLKDKSLEDKIQRREFPHCPGGKIPTSLSAVAMKALAVKQEARYQTVQELQADIEAHQGGFATSAEEANLFTLISLMIKRNKKVTYITILCLVLIFAISFWYVYNIWQTKEELWKERVTVIAQNKQLETQRDELIARKTILEEQKVMLEQQKGTLEKQKDTLEKQKSDLEKTNNALVEEKKRTETERAAKEAEMMQKQQEMQAKNAALEGKEKERQAKEAALASELSALRAAEESRLAEERERKAKEEEARKREEVSVTSAPEFVKKAKTLAAELKWDKALEAIETAVNLDKFHSEAWYVKGWLHIGNLEFAHAVKAFANSGEVDTMGLVTLAKSYEQLLGDKGDKLNIFQLRELTRIVKGKQDFVLGDRLYQLALAEENEILDRLSKIKIDLRKANLELVDIHYSFNFSEDSINLDLSGNQGLRNILPLSGLPITNLNLAGSQVDDIRPLKGMPLNVLHLPARQDADISPLIKDMPLTELHLHGKPSIDFNSIAMVSQARIHLHLYGFDDEEDYKLEFLERVPIAQTHLHLHGKEFNDLNLFLAVPLTRISFHGTAIKDITALNNKKIEYLDMAGMDVRNIRPLTFMPLKYLNLSDTPVNDISLLSGKSLEYLSVANTKVRNIEVLRGMPIVELDISNTGVTDYSVMEGMKTLKKLYINKLPIVDFRFIRNLRLETLHMAETFASDIEMLKDMELKELNINGTRVTTLTVLERKPLSYLSIRNTPISNLSTLKGMPLRQLDISKTPVNDITPLTGMNLTTFAMAETEVTDISPLKGMPLKALSLRDCQRLKDILPLNDCKNLYKLILPNQVKEVLFLQKFLNLEYIGTTGELEDLQQSATQFWAQFTSN